MSDLIEHFRLDARIQGDHTLQTEFVSDLRRGMRKVRVEKRWFRQKHIGIGAFGEVWLEVHREQEQVVAERAVKSLHKRRMESLNIDYKRELLALAKLSRYPELFVSLHGWYEDSDNVFLAMEYLQHGDLGNFITRGSTEDGARMICAQLLDGLNTMHSLDFTHRDLKPQNIFVVSTGPQWWIKIGDFGIAKRISLEQTALRTQAGTRQFQAPEILGYVEEAVETSEYTNLVDIWSLGCVTHLILTNAEPFVNTRALIGYCSGRIEFAGEVLRDRGVSVDGRDFVVALLNPHPSQRPAAQVASQHNWLQVSSSTPGISVEVDEAWEIVQGAENETAQGSKRDHGNGMKSRQDWDSAYHSAHPVEPTIVQSNYLQEIDSSSRSFSGTAIQHEFVDSDIDSVFPSWSLRSQEQQPRHGQGSGQVSRGWGYGALKTFAVPPYSPGVFSRLKDSFSSKDKAARSTDFSNVQPRLPRNEQTGGHPSSSRQTYTSVDQERLDQPESPTADIGGGSSRLIGTGPGGTVREAEPQATRETRPAELDPYWDRPAPARDRNTPATYMNQSIFSMIAATGSRKDFNTRFNESSDSDGEYPGEEFPREEDDREEYPGEEYLGEEFPREEDDREEYPREEDDREEYLGEEFPREEDDREEYSREKYPGEEFPREEDDREEYSREKYPGEEFPREEDDREEYTREEDDREEYLGEEYPGEEQEQTVGDDIPKLSTRKASPPDLDPHRTE